MCAETRQPRPHCKGCRHSSSWLLRRALKSPCTSANALPQMDGAQTKDVSCSNQHRSKRTTEANHPAWLLEYLFLQALQHRVCQLLGQEIPQHRVQGAIPTPGSLRVV